MHKEYYDRKNVKILSTESILDRDKDCIFKLAEGYINESGSASK
jgi:hypothetical protein